MSAPADIVPALVLQQLTVRPMTTSELTEAARRNGVLLPALVVMALLDLERDDAITSVRLGWPHPSVLWAVSRR